MVMVECQGKIMVKVDGIHARDIEHAKYKAINLAKCQREVIGFGQAVSVPAVMIEKRGNTYGGAVAIESRRNVKRYREVLY